MLFSVLLSQLWMEPGRFMVAESGVLLTRVTQVKMKNAVRYIGVNTGAASARSYGVNTGATSARSAGVNTGAASARSAGVNTGAASARSGTSA